MIILNIIVWISGVCNVTNCAVCAISMQYILIIKHVTYILEVVIRRSWRKVYIYVAEMFWHASLYSSFNCDGGKNMQH